MTTKPLRKDIFRRFWLMLEYIEDYDPYITLQIYRNRHTGTCIEVGSCNGKWNLIPRGVHQYVAIVTASDSNDSKAMTKAYIGMARYARILEALHE